MGMAVNSSVLTPPSPTSAVRISFTIVMNDASREPRSESIAALTVSLVVRGPGVNSSLSWPDMDDAPKGDLLPQGSVVGRWRRRGVAVTNAGDLRVSCG